MHDSTRNRKPERRAVRARRGFTLIETSLAVIIVGVGVLAIMAAQQAFHQQNDWSMRAATGIQLGNEIREMTLMLPKHDPVTGSAVWGAEANETWVGAFDDLDDFDGEGEGLVFSAAAGNGPLNARREVIANMDGWSQTVTVENIDPFEIYESASDGSTSMVKVNVLVEYDDGNGAVEIAEVSWISRN